jgi:hypothetical protein
MPAADLASWAVDWKPDTAWSALPSVSRDDLPLLFASVEHRAWTAAFEAFLRGQRETLPLVHHQCSFGPWLENHGQARHGTHPAFPELILLHRKAHALAKELEILHAQGQGEDALKRLEELFALRDALLGQLKALIRT